MKNNNFLYNLDELKKSQNNIILFGEVGSGKTTLINKLCKKNFETREGGYSCTKDIQYEETLDRNIFIDFPGINPYKDIMKHLTIQKSILSVIPVKMICFVIKSNTRYDSIIKTTFQMLKIFYENRENIVIILTFSEGYNDKQKDEIKSVLNKKFKINENSIIFSGINVNPSEILKNINELKKNFCNISTININEKKLINSELTEEIIDFKERKYNNAIYLNKLLEGYNSQNDDIKRALYSTFKNYINNNFIFRKFK